MQIAVVGAGAIGSAVGGLLARAGHEVTLVGRGDHIAAIRRDGLRVDGTQGAFAVSLAAGTRIETRPDLVLLAVKSQDVAEAVREHRDGIASAPVVAMQNGIRSEGIIRGVLPESPVVGCVVVMTVNFLEAGRVTLVHLGGLVLGAPDGARNAVVNGVARTLATAVPTTVTDHLFGARWTKVLVNLNNALPALVNEPLAVIADDPYMRRLAVELMREGYRTARRGKVRLEDLPGFPVRRLRIVTALPRGIAARSYARGVRSLAAGGDVLGSTLQSLRRGRPTEVDYLNGEVVALGRSLGVRTPLNDNVVRLVHRVESTGTFLSPAEVRREMTAPS